jgi:hypothetical protein
MCLASKFSAGRRNQSPRKAAIGQTAGRSIDAPKVVAQPRLRGDPMSADRLFVWFAAGSAIVAAFMWLKAALIEVNIPEEKDGRVSKQEGADIGELEKFGVLDGMHMPPWHHRLAHPARQLRCSCPSSGPRGRTVPQRILVRFGRRTCSCCREVRPPGPGA